MLWDASFIFWFFSSEWDGHGDSYPSPRLRTVHSIIVSGQLPNLRIVRRVPGLYAHDPRADNRDFYISVILDCSRNSIVAQAADINIFFDGIVFVWDVQLRFGLQQNTPLTEVPHLTPLCQYLRKNRLRSRSIARRTTANTDTLFDRAISLISLHCSGVKSLRSSLASSRALYSSRARRTISDLRRPVFSWCSSIHSFWCWVIVKVVRSSFDIWRVFSVVGSGGLWWINRIILYYFIISRRFFQIYRYWRSAVSHRKPSVLRGFFGGDCFFLKVYCFFIVNRHIGMLNVL